MKKVLLTSAAFIVAAYVGVAHAALVTPAQSSGNTTPLSFDLGQDATWTSSITAAGDGPLNSGTLKLDLTSQSATALAYLLSLNSSGLVDTKVTSFGFGDPVSSSGDPRNPPSAVPVPGAILLGLIGLTTAAVRRRS